MICDICGKEFTSKIANFRRHLKNIHNKIIENVTYNVKCMEFSCDFACFMLKDLRHHLQTKHNIQQEVQELCFPNMEGVYKIKQVFVKFAKFKKWKNEEETRCRSVWIKQCGTIKADNSIYYYCSRSGKKRTISMISRKRVVKSQGSRKLNFACTSSILVKNVSDGIKIKYHKTHYGHDNQMAHLPLSENTKNMIASQIMQGIPHTTILNKIRESVDTGFQRIHLTTGKDIHNIAQAYNLYDKAVKNSNDAMSVDMWVAEESESKETDCVILYKKQGVEHTQDSLRKQDFLLGIMTKCQIQILKRFGTGGIVCMDATHGTNPYDFHLITILVVDDFGEGFPVAFLFANREDYVVLKYFIRAVKETVGDIKANVFMSDDAEQYFSAWGSVMDVTITKKLLCTWHVDRAWRTKITSIKHKAKQEQAYKMLCVLRQETDVKKFEEYLNSFLLLTSNDLDFQTFALYFRQNYANRVSVWATCYRLGSAINTNMYLESMHKVLKYIYLKGVTCRRLDKTIHVLLKYVRDKQFQRIIKLEKGKVTHKINKINKSHSTAVNSKDILVTKNENGWEVQSKDECYFVKAKNTDNHECKLSCAICSSCVHRYTCTCMDYVINNNMCKHIHKVCMNDNDGMQVVYEEHANNEEIEMHVETLRRPDMNVLQDKVKNTINNLTLIDLSCVKDKDALNKINSYLTSALNLINCTSDPSFNKKFDHVKLCPANKKIAGQLRFYSTKNKKVKASRLGKPSSKEKEEITKQFDEVSFV